VGYAETGPAGGSAVILLHGWPYDIYSFVDVASLLASAGYRVIVPYLRGYGTTRFLSSETFRNAQQSAVALDIIALMDALKIQTATVAGFDWGARTADVMATLWPERCKAIVSVVGYLISSPAGNQVPWPPGHLACATFKADNPSNVGSVKSERIRSMPPRSSAATN
jgi:pimeloyl-ACP methyl ester carboxylesterase